MSSETIQVPRLQRPPGHEGLAFIPTTASDPDYQIPANQLAPLPSELKNDDLSLRRDLDEEEKQRHAALNKMGAIEKDFAAMKEKYFAEKEAAVAREIALIEEGTHEGFLSRVKHLTQRKDAAVKAALRWKEYQIRNANQVYATNVQQSEKELALDVDHLKKKLKKALTSNLAQLKREQAHLTKEDLNRGPGVDKKQKGKKSSRNKVQPIKDRKRRLDPPIVTYSLPQENLSEDLRLARRAPPTKRAALEAVLHDIYCDVQTQTVVVLGKQFHPNATCVVVDKQGKVQTHGVFQACTEASLTILDDQGKMLELQIEQFRRGDLVLL